MPEGKISPTESLNLTRRTREERLTEDGSCEAQLSFIIGVLLERGGEGAGLELQGAFSLSSIF